MKRSTLVMKGNFTQSQLNSLSSSLVGVDMITPIIQVSYEGNIGLIEVDTVTGEISFDRLFE